MDRELTPSKKRMSGTGDKPIIDMVIAEQLKLQGVKTQVAELEKSFMTISEKIIKLRTLNSDLAKQNSELKICMSVLKNHILVRDSQDPMGRLPTPRTPRSE